MDVNQVIVMFMLVLCVARDVDGSEQNFAVTSVSGFALEMILTKLDHLQDKIVELESTMRQVDLKLSGDMNKLSGDLSELSQRTEEKLYEIVRTMNDHNQSIAQILSAQQNIVNQMSDKFPALQLQPTAQLPQEMEHTDNATHDQIRDISIPSCKETPSNRSGKYLIQPTKSEEPFWVYCEQTVFGGGWLVFQHRYDGSLDFYRNWTEYRNGFGDIEKEYWLGLEHLYRLTSARPYELLLEMKDFDEDYSYAHYDEFEVGSETEKFALKMLGKYTGTSYDALNFHKGEKFSTMDRDNDSYPNLNCASYHVGAWWFSNCALSHLNGPYRNYHDARSMFWRAYKPLAFTRMLIREK